MRILFASVSDSSRNSWISRDSLLLAHLLYSPFSFFSQPLVQQFILSNTLFSRRLPHQVNKFLFFFHNFDQEFENAMFILTHENVLLILVSIVIWTDRGKIYRGIVSSIEKERRQTARGYHTKSLNPVENLVINGVTRNTDFGVY